MYAIKSKAFKVDNNVVTFYMHEYTIKYRIDYDDGSHIKGCETIEDTTEATEYHFEKYCNAYKSEMIIIYNLDLDRRDSKMRARFDELNRVCHGLTKEENDTLKSFTPETVKANNI